MPMDYSDEVIRQALERVRAGETVKAVSRDLRVPPKIIREWVAADNVIHKVRKFLDGLTPEQLEALATEMNQELGEFREDEIRMTSEVYVGPKDMRHER